jgi:hypothetical protein
MQLIWDVLYKLYSVLKNFGLAVLDLSLGILNLKVSDLFNPDLYSTIEKAVKDLYAKSKATLDRILNFFDIPTPAFADVRSPEKEIEHFVKSILSCLWSQFWKKVDEIRNLIKLGLRLRDIASKGLPFPTQPIWDAAVNAVLGKYLDLLKNPPTMKQILDALTDYARSVYKRAEVTAAEILAVLKRFTLPILGFPLDWELPLNLSVRLNSIDLAQVLADMKIWINNFTTNLIKKFINSILRILSLFGLSINFPTIPIPLTACAIRTY